MAVALAHMTDVPPLERLRRGDEDALRDLYLAHGTRLYRAAFRVSGSAQDAEDAVHDLFVGLPDLLRTYEERGRMAAWLKRTVVRLVLMRLRRDRRLVDVPIEDLADRGATRTQRPSELIDLERAMASIPHPLRTVLVLKMLEGYSHAEIADLLGISRAASRVRLARALTHLRNSLGADS